MCQFKWERAIREKELWNAVAVALEGKDCKALKETALNLLVYVG